VASKYAAYLGSVLTTKVDKLQEHSIRALSLRDEVSILEMLLGDTLEMLAKATEAMNEDRITLGERVTIMGKVKSQVYEAANQLRDMMLAAKRLEEDSKQVDISILHAMVTQTVEIVDDEMLSMEDGLMRAGVSPQFMMDKIASRLRENLLTVNQVAKTQLTAERLDAEVQAMIDTVPAVA